MKKKYTKWEFVSKRRVLASYHEIGHILSIIAAKFEEGEGIDDILKGIRSWAVSCSIKEKGDCGGYCKFRRNELTSQERFYLGFGGVSSCLAYCYGCVFRFDETIMEDWGGKNDLVVLKEHELFTSREIKRAVFNLGVFFMIPEVMQILEYMSERLLKLEVLDSRVISESLNHAEVKNALLLARKKYKNPFFRLYCYLMTAIG